MLVIKSLQLRGFKSFNKKTELNFQHGLNCIIGPNGSGKSNILDGLCFVLGRRSSQDMRAENFADLLFKRKGVAVAEGEVSIVLDNSRGLFPIGSQIVELKRKIKKNGQTQYKINGKNATRQQVLDLLAPARIFPNGHNIILQGDIHRFVDLKPIERRQLIEEIAGIAIYEEKKAKALLELNKVDEKLREVNIVLKEKETYMKNLEAEKKGALTYKELQENLKKYRAGELELKRKYAKERYDKTIAEIESKTIEIEDTKLELEISSKKIVQFKQQLENLEKEIQKKGGEESLALQKEIESIKIELEKARAIISASLSALENVQKRKADLEQNLSNLETKLKEKQAEKENLEKEILALEKEETALKKFSVVDLKNLETSIDKLEKEIDSLKTKKDDLNTNIQQLRAKSEVQEGELKLLQNRIEQLKNSTKEYSTAKALQQKLAKEIEQLSKEDSQIALKLGELKKEIIGKEESLTKSKILAKGSQDALLRDSAIRVLKEKAISGVYGTVAELGSAKQQYAAALSVAAGNRIRNIVVDKIDTAIKCIELLKNSKAGIATFLPIDKLRVVSDDIPNSVLKKPGVLGLAQDLIVCDAKYKKVFNYVFRNTLVVQDIETAKSLGIGKYRMVTLDGDLFETSGAISGGFRAQASIVFETVAKEQIEKLELEIKKLNEQFEKLNSERAKLESNLLELRKSKLEIDAKVELSEKEALAKEISNFEKRASQLEEAIKKNFTLIEKLEKELVDIETKINEKVAERNAVKIKLHEARFGSSAEKIAELQQKRSELESALAAIKATIENALLVDKENVSRVLKELEKEKKSFEKQIADEELKIKNLEKELETKEKEQEAFHGKLKQAFEEQANLARMLRDAESAYNKFLAQQDMLEQTKNNLMVEKAKYEAELSTIEGELALFVGVEPAQFKTLEEANKKIRETEAKLSSLGNVNMRALEVFEDVLKEYNELSIKTSKLQEEKASVLSVIDEVEKKKTEAFMKTFSQLNSNFSNVYDKISTRYKGELYLENVEKPFEGGVLVRITDTKKKSISITSLSGGEKVLIALAFIFAIQEHEPASFYLMDEIDAALDKLNSEKVAALLKEYSKRAQVIIITHNDAIISEADSIYGVSMNKNGESAMVSLRI